MSNEVTREELLNNFDIFNGPSRSTGWQQEFSIRESEDGERTTATLRWDEDMGYSFYVDGKPSEKLKSFMDRPEFEYVLDCIANGGE